MIASASSRRRSTFSVKLSRASGKKRAPGIWSRSTATRSPRSPMTPQKSQISAQNDRGSMTDDRCSSRKVLNGRLRAPAQGRGRTASAWLSRRVARQASTAGFAIRRRLRIGVPIGAHASAARTAIEAGAGLVGVGERLVDRGGVGDAVGDTGRWATRDCAASAMKSALVARMPFQTAGGLAASRVISRNARPDATQRIGGAGFGRRRS